MSDLVLFGAGVDFAKLLTIFLSSPGRLTTATSFAVWWETWETTCFLYNDLYRAYSDDPPVLYDPSSPEGLAWRAFSRKAFALLFNCCAPDVIPFIRKYSPSSSSDRMLSSSLSPAYLAVKELRRVLLKTDTSASFSLFKEFMSACSVPYSGSSTSDMSVLLARFEDFWHRSSSNDLGLPENVLCLGMLSTLPYTHMSILLSSLTNKKENLRFTIARDHLLSIAQTQQLSLSHVSSSSLSSASSTLVSLPNTSLKPIDAKSICWNCGLSGHRFPACSRPKNDAFIKQQKEKFLKSKSPSRHPSRPQSVVGDEDDVAQDGTSYLSSVCHSFDTQTNSDVLRLGLWDGGSSLHLCSVFSYFHSFTKFDAPKKIGGINKDHPVFAIGFGSVYLRFNDTFCQMSSMPKPSKRLHLPIFRFTKMYFVEDIPVDVIISSTTFALTTGYDFCVRKVNCNNGDATLERNNDVVARFLRNTNANQHLFDFTIQNPPRLDVSKPLPSISSFSAIESQKTSVSVISNSRLLLLRTLHTKFGHMHLRNIQKLLTSSSLKCAGIPSSFSITSSDILNFRCDSCSLGKCRSVSFSSHTPSSRVSTPGSKIIFDLEYVPVASLNNNHYVLC